MIGASRAISSRRFPLLVTGSATVTRHGLRVAVSAAAFANISRSCHNKCLALFELGTEFGNAQRPVGGSWRRSDSAPSIVMDNALPRTSRLARLCTGVQHASTLVMALGFFVWLAALNTDPHPVAVENLGLLVIGVGLIGFIVGWLGRTFISRRSTS